MRVNVAWFPDYVRKFFVLQKTDTPKNGELFRQKYIGAIRFSLATLYGDVRHFKVLLQFHPK